MNSLLVHHGFGRILKTEHVEIRIYPVELSAKIETGSPLPTGEYTPPDTTQLESKFSVHFFLQNPSAVVVIYSCEFSHTYRATPTRLNLTVESRVNGVY